MRLPKISVLLAAAIATVAAAVPLTTEAAIPPSPKPPLKCKAPAVAMTFTTTNKKTGVTTTGQKCVVVVEKPLKQCKLPAVLVTKAVTRRETNAEKLAGQLGSAVNGRVPVLDKNGDPEVVQVCKTKAPKPAKKCPTGTTLVGNNCKIAKP